MRIEHQGRQPEIHRTAHVGRGAQVRINGVVHLKTRIAPGAVVPVGWVAVGDPATILPPGAESLDDIMPALTERYARALAAHRGDRILDEEE